MTAARVDGGWCLPAAEIVRSFAAAAQRIDRMLMRQTQATTAHIVVYRIPASSRISRWVGSPALMVTVAGRFGLLNAPAGQVTVTR